MIGHWWPPANQPQAHLPTAGGPATLLVKSRLPARVLTWAGLRPPNRPPAASPFTLTRPRMWSRTWQRRRPVLEDIYSQPEKCSESQNKPLLRYTFFPPTSLRFP